MSCTWCKVQRTIKQPFFSGTQAVILEWTLVMGVVAFAMALVQLFGETHGFAVMVVLAGTLILVPLTQALLGISNMLSWLGILTRRVPCPHCAKDGG
jgi:hypothetical protein